MTFSPGVLSSAADRLLAGPDQSFMEPVRWSRAMMRGWDPATYQENIMQALATHRKVSVVGPHGIGKTSVDANVVFWFGMTREKAGVDWKVVTTAGAWRQLQRYLWPEIHKWSKRLRDPLYRDALHTLELKLGNGQAFAVASDDPANIEGAHADEILYIIDEAKNVPPATWDAIEGAMSAGNAYCLANSTPGKAEGRLYEIHSKRRGFEDWHTIHVTLAEAIAAGRVNEAWAKARARQWGENSAVYKNRVLGEFSTTDSDGIIPLEWLEIANERWLEIAKIRRESESDLYREANREELRLLERGDLTAVAADVATEEGVDKTIIAVRYGDVISRLVILPKVDTMETVGKVMEMASLGMTLRSKKRRPLAVIDAVGVGTGVVDRLREQRMTVDAFIGGGKAKYRDATGELTFLNRRAESWWHLKDLLNPAFGSEEIAIPDDPELIGDLVAPMIEQTSTGHLKVEDKDEIIKRLGRSPDMGDAVTMAYNARIDRVADLTSGMPVGLTKTSKWRDKRSVA